LTIRAVLFDLFETLVTEYDPDFAARPTMASMLGCDPASYRRRRQAMSRDINAGEMSYRDALRAIRDELGGTADDAVIDRILAQRRERQNRTLCQESPAVLAMLDRLRAADIVLCLVSNTDASEVSAWGSSKLAAYFPVVCFSFEVGAVKPEPAIYAEACRRAKVGPDEAIFVGDGGSDELAGATDYGLHAYCAAWFLQRFEQEGMVGLVEERAKGHEVLRRPGDVVRVLEGAGTAERNAYDHPFPGSAD
jgi:putative hydrolase of the HAD superfamily